MPRCVFTDNVSTGLGKSSKLYRRREPQVVEDATQRPTLKPSHALSASGGGELERCRERRAQEEARERKS
jgi:hypothetical protein